MKAEQENQCVLGLWCKSIVSIVWVKSCCLVGLRDMRRWSEQKYKRNKSGGRKKRHRGEVGLQVLRESEGGEIKSFNILLQHRERSKER